MKLLLIGMGPGIGLSVAKYFGRKGFEILMVARSAAKLGDYEKELELEGIPSRGYAVDIADDAAFLQLMQQLAGEYPDLDILHYNASAFNPALPSEIELPVFMSDLKINVVGALLAAQAFFPGFKNRKQGVIFLTGGGSALKAPPTLASLSIGKAGIRNLAFSLAEEGKPHNIHVATLTVCGMVQPGTRFDPDRIADEFWQLYRQPRDQWQTEVMME